MQEAMEPWKPHEVCRNWLPVHDSPRGGVEAHGLSGFNTREECQAECDRRNALLLGEAKANVARLERELRHWQAIEAKLALATVGAASATT